MKTKYGVTKICAHCHHEFITRPRFLEYCSTPCKNPINRPGHIPWNKGATLTPEQLSKLNTSGLQKGHGWNRGLPNERQSLKWIENNPNKDGRLNNLRPKKVVTDEFALYKQACRKASYRTLYAMRKEGLTQKTGKRKTDMQLDHIIPYRQGFELGIPPEIIGSRQNLRYILGAENRSKWDSFQPVEVVIAVTGGQYGLFTKVDGPLRKSP